MRLTKPIEKVGENGILHCSVLIMHSCIKAHSYQDLWLSKWRNLLDHEMHIYDEAKDRENNYEVHIPHLNCLQETIPS